MTDELNRFIDAQDRVWSDVLRELAEGQKTSHWMWFVFPQLATLGRSHTAQHYGIRDLAEAEAYLKHPLLGSRLRDASRLMLQHKGRDPREILGGVDAMKLRSSMTLFARLPDAPKEFAQVLRDFYGNAPCPLTIDFLAK